MKKELKFEFTADAKQFENKIDQVRDDIDNFKKRVEDEEAIKLSVNVATIQKQIDLVKARIKKAKDSGDLEAEVKLTADLERMKQSLTGAKRELRNYVRTGEKDVSVLGKLFAGVNEEIEKNRKELQKAGKSTRGLDKIQKEITKTTADFREGKISLEKYTQELKDLQSQAGKTGGGLGDLSGKLGKLTGALAVIGGAGFVAQQIIDVEGAMRKLENQTGATGQELGQLKESFNDLTGKGFTNLEQNVQVLSKVKKELGLVGDEATRISAQYLSIGETFEKDVNEVIRASTGLVRNFGIEAEASNDLIIGALQKSGDLYDDILDTLNEYSTQFSLAGYSAQEFTNVIVNGSQKGAFMIDKVGDAVKEATISLLDNSKTTRDAFDKMGLDYDAFLDRLNSGEVTVKDALGLINEELQNLDKGLRDEVGTAIYKTKWEDLSEDVIYSLTNIEDTLGDVDGKAQETAENLEAGLNHQIGQLKGVMVEIISFILPALLKGIQFLKVAFNTLAFGVAFLGVKLANVFQGGVAWVKDFIENSKNYLEAGKKIFEIFVENIGTFFNNIPAYAKEGLNAFLDSIAETVNKAIRMLNKLPKVNIQEVQFEGFEAELKEYRKFQEVQVKDTITAERDKAKAQKEIREKALQSYALDVEKSNKEILGKETSIAKIGAKERAKATAEENKKKLLDLKEYLRKKEELEKEKAKNGAGGGESEKEKELQKELEETKKAIQEKAEANKKAYGSILNDFDKGLDGLEKYIEGIEKAQDKIEDFKDSAKDSIRDINQELGELNTQGTEDLATRYLDIQDELAQAKKDLNDELAEEKGYTEDVLELQEKIKKLKEESALAQKNLTDEQIETAKTQRESSETEILLQEQEAQKKILEERKKIYEAIAEGEKINLEEIQDYKNLKLAEELTSKQEALETELQNMQDNFEKQRQELIKYNNDRKKFESDWTKFFGTEINKQMDYQKQLQKQLLRTIELQRQAGVSGVNFGSSVSQERENQVRESVAQSEGTKVTINQTNNNLVDFDQAMREINNVVE